MSTGTTPQTRSGPVDPSIPGVIVPEASRRMRQQFSARLPSSWNQDFLAYDCLYAFTFENSEDLQAGVSLLYQDERLKGCPRKGSGKTILIPDVAAAYFDFLLLESNLGFKRERVRKIGEFPAETASRMRQKAGLIY